MPIEYEHLKSLRTRGERVSYGDRDTLLYALGVGLGRDPANREELSYVARRAGLKAVPSFASLLAATNLLDDCGWDLRQVALQAESVTFLRPLDESGSLLLDSEVAAVLDKGSEAGAVISTEIRARRESDAQPVFSVYRTWLASADGGFGGPRRGSEPAVRQPDRPPDMTQSNLTRPDQGIVFGLSTDRHVPSFGTTGLPPAGTPGAPLHALCLQGIACHAILRIICEYDHTLIRSFSNTFTGIAFPGETLDAELWQEANVVYFRLRSQERDTVVLDQGRCVLHA
ncbi:MAG: hypothetical protein R3F24_13830 [Gammaproteobacteria bacterium]